MQGGDEAQGATGGSDEGEWMCGEKRMDHAGDAGAHDEFNNSHVAGSEGGSHTTECNDRGKTHKESRNKERMTEVELKR